MTFATEVISCVMPPIVAVPVNAPFASYADRSTPQEEKRRTKRPLSLLGPPPSGDAHAPAAWEAQRAQANGARHAEDRRSNRALVASRLAAHASRRALRRRAGER